MRSKRTNILQFIILFTGLVYISAGLIFYIHPIGAIQAFAMNISENWFDLVKDHELVGPMYYFFRAFSALLFAAGCAMILPLFDPLRYRGMIYYIGLLFPMMASVVLVKNAVLLVLKYHLDRAIVGGNAHLGGSVLIVIAASVFLFITIATSAGLLLTRKNARDGVE